MREIGFDTRERKLGVVEHDDDVRCIVAHSFRDELSARLILLRQEERLERGRASASRIFARIAQGCFGLCVGLPLSELGQRRERGIDPIVREHICLRGEERLFVAAGNTEKVLQGFRLGRRPFGGASREPVALGDPSELSALRQDLTHDFTEPVLVR